MRTLAGIARRLRAFVWRNAAERELEDEIRLHLALETEKNVALGMEPVEARRRAMIAFGGVEVAREAHRDGRGFRRLEELANDSRFALRTLARRPALASTAIVTLALGIGANTAIFSAVNAVILRPLPFAAPDRLVMLGEDNAEYNWHHAAVAPANFFDWREQVGAFQDAAVYVGSVGTATLSGAASPVLLRSWNVSGSFFSVLGVRAEKGRTFTDDETWNNGTLIAMISHRLWRDQLGGDPDIADKTVELNGRPVKVVGVVPESFAFPGMETDIWRPMAFDPHDRTQAYFRRAHWLGAIARLRPGVTIDAADAQLQTVVRRLQRDYPATNARMGAGMTPLHDALIGSTRRPLLILLGAVALLLLIACANVGNLLLVQAAGREREVALRLALGAGRLRLMRQALTESLVLSLFGGAAGLALGWWGTRALAALQPAGMLPVRDLGMNWSVLVYVFSIAMASGLLFGTAPAFWSGKRVPAEVLKEGGRGGSGGQRMRRLGNALVVSEVALALLLTVGAGLFVRSLWRLRQVDPGFEPAGLLTFSLSLPSIRYDSVGKIVRFYDDLVRNAKAVPGVDGAATVSRLPLTSPPWSSDFSIAGRGPEDFGTNVVHREVSPDYERVMKIRLVRGRLLTEQDRRGAPLVVLINEALAARYFRNEDPIGRRICFDRIPDSTSAWRTIVGVVGSERQAGLAREPIPEFIAPFAQDMNNATSIVVRTRGEPSSFGPAMRRVVASMDPNLAIASMQTMNEVRGQSVALQRFLTTMMLVFAGVGLLLAVVGVYGVMAQLAQRRFREMGIRIALGAQAAQVQWLVLRQGMALVAAGVAIGTTAALGTTGALRLLLFEVTPADPVTFVMVPLVLGSTALVAIWLPAMRASRSDPVRALREE